MENIKKAIDEFKALQSREIHPEGTFDKAGRWYPSDVEKGDCCKSLRPPSRTYPYSLMVHCRTLKHICTKYGLEYVEVKKIMNSERPKGKKKDTMYKKCALVNNKICSVYTGEPYTLGKTYCEKVKDNHQGGYYCYKTIKEAEKAVFPEGSQCVDAKKIIVKVEMWGRHIQYDNKYAYTYMKIIAICDIC